MDTFRVSMLCYWNGSLFERDRKVEYIGGEHRLILCKSDMSLDRLKRHICSKLGFDSRSSSINLKFKYEVRGSSIAHRIDNDDALEIMWFHAQSFNNSIEVFVEKIDSEGQNTPSFEEPQHASTPPFEEIEPTFPPGFEQIQHTFSHPFHQTQEPFSPFYQQTQPSSSYMPYQIHGIISNMPSTSHTPYEFPQNIQETQTLSPSRHLDSDHENDNENESEEDPESPSDEEELDLEHAYAIVPPSTYASQIPPYADYREDNSWRNWACDTSMTEEGEFQKGLVFDNKDALLEAVRVYHITRNVEYKTVTSNTTVLALKCKRGCDWKLRATSSDYASAFQIVTYKGPHGSACVSNDVSTGHIHLTSSVINNLVQNCVAQDPAIRVSLIRQMVKDKFHLDVPYMRAWHGKQQALMDLYGSWEASYNNLPLLFKAMQHTNPGTVVEWFYKEDNDQGIYYRSSAKTFQRVFWAFRPSIEGFTHCKPLIAIDGTHLYGKYRHTLLTAIAQDGNKQIFPIAFALVEKENVPAWYWFLSCIRRYVTRRMGLCVVSDRHAGIMGSMEAPEWRPPHAYHRFCIRHLLSNFNRHHRNVRLKKFGKTAEQRQAHKVTKGLERIARLKPEARQWIADAGDIDKWSMCYDGGHRYGVTNTNLAEVFNFVLKGVRFLPVMTLVEFSFYRVNEYFVTRRAKADEWKDAGNPFTFQAVKMIAKNTEKARFHEVTTFAVHQGIYGVKTGRGVRGSSKGGKQHTVNLQESTCTCNKLLIYHLPCSHIITVCMKRHMSHDAFVDPCYSSDNYANTYKGVFMPLPDKRVWPPHTGVELHHDPSQVRGSGRPRSKRITNEMDEAANRGIICRHCRQEGHNSRTCPIRDDRSGTGRS